MKFPWLKKIQDFFTFLLEEDIRNDFKDDGKPYFVLEKQRKFLKNSCKGDYRLYRLQEGFCACWKDRIVARNEDGLQRWELDGWGRCLSVSPDKTRIVAANKKQLCIFNAATGQSITLLEELDCFIDYIIWTDEQHIVASDGHYLYLFHEDGQLLTSYYNAIQKGGFIGGLCPDEEDQYTVILLDVNHRCIKKVNLQEKKVLIEKDADAADQLLTDGEDRFLWTTIVNGTYLEEIKVYDSKNLREKIGLFFKGKMGVRFANQYPNDISYHSWISLPSLDPSRQHFLVNDNSGLLWLIDARTGDKRRIFRRNLLDYVYATLWLDEDHFVAMLEDGWVVKMDIRGKQQLFRVIDLKEQVS